MTIRFNFLVFLLSSLLFLATAGTATACDFDGDGTDDTFSVREENGLLTYEVFLSGGGSLTETGFSPLTAVPAPGTYYTSTEATFGYVDIDTFFWIIKRPDMTADQLNFGITNVSYMPGQDWNGDGITDLGKFLNRCGTRLKGRCARGPVTGNFLFNGTDGSETFVNASTGTGFYGKGGSDIFAADADNDGNDDVCFTLPLRRNPRIFQIKCKSPVTDATVFKKRVGRIFESPFAVQVNGVTNIVTWKQRKRRNGVLLFLHDTQTKRRRKVPLDNVPVNAAPMRPLVGDWQGLGSQQIAFPGTDGVRLYNPADSALSDISFPAGTPYDCRTTLLGDEDKATFTSRNVCKVFRKQCQ